MDIYNLKYCTFDMKSLSLGYTYNSNSYFDSHDWYYVLLGTGSKCAEYDKDGRSWGLREYTSGMHEKMLINGTINLEQTIFEAIGSKINTTLTQAITTAEQTIGKLCVGGIWWTTWRLPGIYNNPWYSWNGIS